MLFLGFICTLLSGCSSSEDDPQPEPKPQLKYQILQNGDEISSIDLNEDTHNLSIQILSNTDWTLSKDVDWITLNATSGKASEMATAVTITVTANETENVREAIVTLKPVSSEQGKTLTIKQKAGKIEKPDDSGWEKASQAVVNMKTGWNLGNTLDSNGQWIADYTAGTPSDYETAWGQPVTRPELMTMFADAGFGAIRVPVTWYQHMDPNTYKVDEAWMNRVEEVVNYVLDAGMYCILNVHHDTGTEGWLIADQDVYGKVNEKFKTLWKQIAERFNKYDHHLLFEGYNEILDINDTWNSPSVSGAYDAANAYNQDFVDVVRASGGNNQTRNLIVNTYAASLDNLESFRLPTDLTTEHLIVQVHSYAPYPFAFDVSEDAYWSKYDKSIFDSDCEKEVRTAIQKLNTTFVSEGIPCIIGEYGSFDKNNVAERAKQAACYVSEAKKYNICCFRWMGLSDGNDRTDLIWTEPEIRDAILNAIK